MTALALSLISKFWPYLLAGAGIIWGLWKARQSGVQFERAKQAQAEQKARQIADQVDNDLNTLTPAQRRERLGKWSAR